MKRAAPILAPILGLGLIASLIALVSVVIARLRRESQPVASR
jgi:hypothetical protein